MKHQWKAFLALTLVAGVGLALAGCSTSPLAPPDPALMGGTTGTFTSPPILTVSSDGTVGYIAAPTGTSPEGVLAAGSLTGPNYVSSSATINGNRGGTVQAGRFSVTIPPGAYAGTATITVTMADSTVMICDLGISPSSANKFKYPAQLTASLAGLSVDPTTFTMYWYDPSKKVWVNLLSQSATSSTGLTAYLDHFSKYSAGKAGW